MVPKDAARDTFKASTKMDLLADGNQCRPMQLASPATSELVAVCAFCMYCGLHNLMQQAKRSLQVKRHKFTWVKRTQLVVFIKLLMH